jgi:translation initiation factor 2 beta subunit (eIF-2beta)/eIF-5
MENYEKLLDEAYGKVKVVERKSDRFEVPLIEGHIEGKKTILTNFIAIASYIRRDPEHFQNSFLKNLQHLGKEKEKDSF